MARVFLLNAQSAPAVVWASEDNLNINNNMINLILTASFPIRGPFVYQNKMVSCLKIRNHYFSLYIVVITVNRNKHSNIAKVTKGHKSIHCALHSGWNECPETLCGPMERWRVQSSPSGHASGVLTLLFFFMVISGFSRWGSVMLI